MSKLPARTRLSPDDRRAQLLQHAIAAFAEHGVARATHAHVAARAGVSVSAAYAYFRTRPALVTAVLDAVAAQIAAMVADSLNGPQAPLPTLVRLATSTADMAATSPDTVRVWLDWSTGVRSDGWPQFLALQQALQQQVAVVLRAAAPGRPTADIQSAARLFVGCAHTLALMRFEDVDADARARFISQMVGGVLAVLGAVG